MATFEGTFLGQDGLDGGQVVRLGEVGGEDGLGVDPVDAEVVFDLLMPRSRGRAG